MTTHMEDLQDVLLCGGKASCKTTLKAELCLCAKKNTYTSVCVCPCVCVCVGV